MHQSSGHVFHPGHQELHGITVVLETKASRTYVGRFDNQDEQGVHLLDVGVYDPAVGGQSQQEFLRRSAKFGIRADHKQLLVPGGEVASIRRFVEVMEQE